MTAPAGRDDAIQIVLMHIPGCPRVDELRVTVQTALAAADLDVQVAEVERSCASPTLLVDGIDVTGITTRPAVPSCRLDLPSVEDVLAALTAASQREHST